MSATEQAIAAERRSIDLDIAWRGARSAKFVEMLDQDGATHPVIWKMLDGDPALAELERQARYAAAEARGAWIEAQRTPIERTPTEETSL